MDKNSTQLIQVHIYTKYVQLFICTYLNDSGKSVCEITNNWKLLHFLAL